MSTATPASRYASSVLERCDALAAFSDDPGRLTRRFATPAWRDVAAAIDVLTGYLSATVSSESGA